MHFAREGTKSIMQSEITNPAPDGANSGPKEPIAIEPNLAHVYRKILLRRDKSSFFL